MRRPSASHRATVAAVVFTLLLPFLGVHCSRSGSPAEPAVLFLVRHAEVDLSASPEDPPLSARGWERAEALAKMLAGTRPTHLYASTTRRTQETLAPLADQTGLLVTSIPPFDRSSWIDALQALPEGAIAVVAGHGNTIPRIVLDLGGDIERRATIAPEGDVLDADSYDRLFIVFLSPDLRIATRTLDLRYGGGTVH